MARDLNIDYNELLIIMRNHLIELMENDYEIYKDLKFEIALEQQFIKTKKKDPNTIYFVLKFGAASVNFCQSVVTADLNVLGPQNQINICQKLLVDYARTFNLTKSENNTIQEIYDTPSVVRNFETFAEGQRSLLSMGCAFLLSKSANFYNLYNYNIEVYTDAQCTNKVELEVNNPVSYIKYISSNTDKVYCFTQETENNKKIIKRDNNILNVSFSFSSDGTYYIKLIKEEIDNLTLSFGFNNNLDSQPFFQKMNFSDSIAKTGTITIGFTTYLLSDIELLNEVLRIVTKQENSSIDHTFILEVEFRSGIKLIDEFKIISADAGQSLGELPTVVVSLTN